MPLKTLLDAVERTTHTTSRATDGMGWCCVVVSRQGVTLPVIFQLVHNFRVLVGEAASAVEAFEIQRLDVTPISPDLLFDPVISRLQSCAQGLSWLPTQLLSDEPVVRVASTYSLRTGDMLFCDPLTGNLGDKIDQLIDGNHLLRPDINGSGKIGA